MKITRMFADDLGEPHFENMEVSFAEMDFAPPMKPISVSEPTSASQILFLHFPAGFVGDRHPSPARQFCVVLSGAIKATVSDGESRDVLRGDIALMEDTTGKGHKVEVLGEEDVYMAMIQLQ